MNFAIIIMAINYYFGKKKKSFKVHWSSVFNQGKGCPTQ